VTVRKSLFLFLLAALVAVPAALAQGEDATEVEATLGGWDASTDDAEEVVSEYEDTDGGVLVGLRAELHRAAGSLLLSSHVKGSDQQRHRLDFDIRRMVRSHTSYVTFSRRLPHDSMANLEATTNHGRVVRHDDLDPGRQYGFDYSDLDHRTELQLPSLPALTLAVNFRQQERDGHRQSITLSHCDGCHVTSQSRPVGEKTQDVGAEAALAFRKWALKASHTQRDLTEDVESLGLLYDRALHPELRTAVFTNRVAFDALNGVLPVDLRPDISKEITRLQASFPDAAGFAVNASGVWSKTTNEYANLDSDYAGYLLNASRRFGPRFTVRWRARAYSTSTDSVFVDIAEPVAQAGPQVGRTYRDVYGLDPDFMLESSLDRDVLESNLDLGLKLNGKAGTLRFLWDYQSLERDNYEVAVGETDTTTNILGLSWTARPAKGVRLEARAKHGEADNPFMLPNGVYSPLVTPAATGATPLAPNSTQYYVWRASRIGDSTNQPESWDELWAKGSFVQGNTTASLSYRWWDGENDGGDLTDWSRTSQTATLSFWSMPSPMVQWSLAYVWHDQELDFPASIALFDG
jgi:hypothetical protein